jgi:hypothetical protein
MERTDSRSAASNVAAMDIHLRSKRVRASIMIPKFHWPPALKEKEARHFLWKPMRLFHARDPCVYSATLRASDTLKKRSSALIRGRVSPPRMSFARTRRER